LVLAIHLRFVFLAFDQLDLVGDPVFLHISSLLINFLDLLLDVVAQVLSGAHELIAVAASLQVGALTVKRVDLQGLLLDTEQALLDVLLNLLDIVLLFLELSFKIVELFLEDLVLSGRVQVVKSHTRDLVRVVLDLNFLLGDVLIGNLGLLEEISRGLLDGLLLRSVRDDIITDCLGLRVQLHD